MVGGDIQYDCGLWHTFPLSPPYHISAGSSVIVDGELQSMSVSTLVNAVDTCLLEPGVNHWPMSLAPTNEDSAWLAEQKTKTGKKLVPLSGQMTYG